MTRVQAEELLRRALDNPNAVFRDGQWEAIDAIVNRRSRMLVVQRTGWGKSVLYFISTRILRDGGAGPTIIISPLLALMRNQVEAANRLEVEAETINSTNLDEWEDVKERVLAGKVDALLISPERLSNDKFVDQILRPIANSVGLFVVDEAHCISDWGHDFRPDYRRLLSIIRQLPPNTPLLGTTATANNRVVKDIETQLPGIEALRGPLIRESLKLETIVLPSQAARLAWLAKHVPQLPGTGIIYTLTKRDARQVADWLKGHGISAEAYFSGVSSEECEDSNKYRQALEQKLLNNDLKVLVATSALGMGYDKPDLGFVIHYQAPGSIIAYYQQVGRAGRAIDTAHGILLSGEEDKEINEFFRTSAFPKEVEVDEILDAVENSDGMSIPQLVNKVNLSRSQIEKVLKLLSVETPAPIVHQNGKWMRTAVVYKMDRDRIDFLTSQREWEWDEIQEYVASKTCLMAFLRNALNDPEIEDCGKCSVCVGRSIVGKDFELEVAVEATRFLKVAELHLPPRKIYIKDAFPHYGFSGKIPANQLPKEGRILSRWMDAGWGSLVAEDKHVGYFRDELVEALAEMIEERWKPSPLPTWVTCVPSLRHPDLVPDFARRLAVRLHLPFGTVVNKVIDTPPQKGMQNSFYQCRNLDGAFEVGEVKKGEPVLLVDDIVDSRWTLTVICALLTQRGSGPVFPVALATTSSGG